MTIDEMKTRKKELGFTNRMISEQTGIPLGTVQKIFSGETRSPRRDTIIALENLLHRDAYADAMAGQGRGSADVRVGPHNGSSGGNSLLVREEAAHYGARPGRYTIEDYYALPDERRVELIDGVFYDMAAPSLNHQAILGALHLQFAKCAEQHPECRVFFAPLDVRLDRDQWTMVQPDLLIICGKDAEGRYLDGAPDFALEILSPSTRSKDMFLKLGKYMTAGVREYWIIDPEKEKVIVYDLEHEETPEIYTFEEDVPVRISEGECIIDFREVKRYARL